MGLDVVSRKQPTYLTDVNTLPFNHPTLLLHVSCV